jgi:hypothetical protein
MDPILRQIGAALKGPADDGLRTPHVRRSSHNRHLGVTVPLRSDERFRTHQHEEGGTRMNALIDASPLGLVTRWSIRSQEQARRNAMASCTVLTARRVERVEVEEFVADYLARRTHADSDAPVAPVSHVG